MLQGVVAEQRLTAEEKEKKNLVDLEITRAEQRLAGPCNEEFA